MHPGNVSRPIRRENGLPFRLPVAPAGYGTAISKWRTVSPHPSFV